MSFSGMSIALIFSLISSRSFRSFVSFSAIPIFIFFWFRSESYVCPPPNGRNEDSMHCIHTETGGAVGFLLALVHSRYVWRAVFIRDRGHPGTCTCVFNVIFASRWGENKTLKCGFLNLYAIIQSFNTLSMINTKFCSLSHNFYIACCPVLSKLISPQSRAEVKTTSLRGQEYSDGWWPFPHRHGMTCAKISQASTHTIRCSGLSPFHDDQLQYG